MAWFTFKCPTHGQFRQSLPKRTQKYPCPQCGALSLNILKAGSIQVLERLDNGAMGRAIERLADIDQIMRERADKHTQEMQLPTTTPNKIDKT